MYQGEVCGKLGWARRWIWGDELGDAELVIVLGFTGLHTIRVLCGTGTFDVRISEFISVS